MTARMTRRGALKLFGALALAAAPAASLVDRAAAGRTWCKSDPLFKIGDHVFDIGIGSDAAMLTAATGPIRIELQVPPGMPVELVFDDNGFGYGYAYTYTENKKLQLKNNSFKVVASVLAPAADGSLPVEVTVTSLSSKAALTQSTVSGFANAPIVWSGKVDVVTTTDLVKALG